MPLQDVVSPDTASQNEKINCLIVHLERAQERSGNIADIKAKVPFPCEVVPAVDGRALTSHDAEHYARFLLSPLYPFRLSTAEIACFLSHRKCWQHIVQNDLDAALIVEDDISIEPKAFQAALKLAMENLHRLDLVRLPVTLRENPAQIIASENGIRLFVPKLVGVGATSQIVSRNAAKSLLDLTSSFDRPVDTFLQLRNRHHLRIASVWPAGIEEISVHLGGSLIKGKKTIRHKLLHELARPIYKLMVNLSSRA